MLGIKYKKNIRQLLREALPFILIFILFLVVFIAPLFNDPNDPWPPYSTVGWLAPKTAYAACGDLVLSGFGTSGVNTSYSPAGTHNGLPYYQNGTYTIWYAGSFGYWLADVGTLSDSDNSHNFYYPASGSASTSTLEGTWVKDTLGSNPVGTGVFDSCGGGGGGGGTVISTSATSTIPFFVVTASGTATSTFFLTVSGLTLINNLQTSIIFLGSIILLAILILVTFKIWK